MDITTPQGKLAGSLFEMRIDRIWMELDGACMALNGNAALLVPKAARKPHQQAFINWMLFAQAGE